MAFLSKSVVALALAGGLLLGANSAQAGVCGAPTPKAGAAIKGPVLHVEDGQTLCVATGFDPSQWVELKLSPAEQTPAPKGALMAAAFGKDVICRVEAVVDGQAIADCAVGSKSVASLLGRPSILKASDNWR